MLRRPQRSSFAAGAFVFPGGAVDGADGTGDAAYAVAGVREVLEEVGILIGALPRGEMPAVCRSGSGQPGRNCSPGVISARRSPSRSS